MAELARFCGIIIAIYFRGEFGRHNLPHVHVKHAGDFASLAIETGAVLEGVLPRPVLRLAREWLALRRSAALAAWNAARAGQPVVRIPPLPPRRGKGRYGSET